VYIEYCVRERKQKAY